MQATINAADCEACIKSDPVVITPHCANAAEAFAGCKATVGEIAACINAGVAMSVSVKPNSALTCADAGTEAVYNTESETALWEELGEEVACKSLQKKCPDLEWPLTVSMCVPGQECQ